ncbi:MAG: YggS family pyridoxal phosphate-dependent enzyme [Spirochaetia bacterium]
MQEIARNIRNITEEIGRICGRCGRHLSEIKIMGVTKTRSREAVMAAYQAGLRLFGENKIQEAKEKFTEHLPDDAELHFIGHLQRNKAKEVPGFYTMVQSVDSLRLISELDKRCAQAGTKLPVLLEYNVSGEESKFGFQNPDDLFKGAGAAMEASHLELRGLMTVGIFTEDKNTVRKGFRLLRKHYLRLQEQYPEAKIDTLSMGMSSDYAAAIEEGSTLVRIGTAIFGPRRYT